MRLFSNFILFLAFFSANYLTVQAQALATKTSQIIGEWHLVHEPLVMEIKANSYTLYIPLNEEGLYEKNRKKWQLFDRGSWEFDPKQGIIFKSSNKENTEAPAYQPVYLYKDYLFLGDFATESKENGEVQGLTPQEYIKEWGYKKAAKGKKK